MCHPSPFFALEDPVGVRISANVDIFLLKSNDNYIFSFQSGLMLLRFFTKISGMQRKI